MKTIKGRVLEFDNEYRLGKVKGDDGKIYDFEDENNCYNTGLRVLGDIWENCDEMVMVNVRHTASNKKGGPTLSTLGFGYEETNTEVLTVGEIIEPPPLENLPVNVQKTLEKFKNKGAA